MLNHMGPGSMIAGIWFMAALPRLWMLAFRDETTQSHTWLRVGIAVSIVGLLFSGLGVIRIPLPPFSDDAYRYIKEINREFQGHVPDDVLLDVGTWKYLQAGVVMKDRSPSIGERGYTETGDFSGMIRRLQQRRYAKILVRDLHSPDLQYDHAIWRQSSGIKRALLEYYREIGSINNVEDVPWKNFGQQVSTLNFRTISILMPKSD
jgi:hypothetical protein